MAQADLSEKDLSEVIQIEQIFTNVPKGQVAKKDDWTKAFGSDNLDKVLEEVSLSGPFQANPRSFARVSFR